MKIAHCSKLQAKKRKNMQPLLASKKRNKKQGTKAVAKT